MDLDTIWQRITAHQGDEFHTKNGKPLTYSVVGDCLYPSRTDYMLPKTDFGKVIRMLPFEGPGVVNNLVRGPAYVWAILHDPRIRQSDW